MTLRDLAKRSSLSLPYVAGLERGTSDAPPMKTCKALARALGINWEEAWQHSFAARFKRWLQREGYAEIPEADLLDVIKKIESTSR